MENYFVKLYGVDVNAHTEKKAGLTYLSWAWAWAEIKKQHPDAVYTVYENQNGWNYHTDGKTAWVKTGVTIEGIEHIEYLPVMDVRNKSIPVDAITSFEVNKAIQRSLTKACARHGLGLYIYAGEDLPEDNSRENVQKLLAAVKDADSANEAVKLIEAMGMDEAKTRAAKNDVARIGARFGFSWSKEEKKFVKNQEGLNHA